MMNQLIYAMCCLLQRKQSLRKHAAVFNSVLAFFNQAKLTDCSAVEADLIPNLMHLFALQRWTVSIPTGASGWKQPLCVTPTHRGWHSGGNSLLVISLDTSLQVNKCSFWVVKPVTLNRAQRRNRTFASGNMRFASCSALWSIFGVMAMQLKLKSLEKNLWK